MRSPYGWPGERLYAGTKYIDKIETIADDILKTLFKAEFADARPISGAVANLAAFTAFSDPGDTMMALSIPRGGHITIGPKRLGGTAGAVHGLEVEYYPFIEEEYRVDIDKTIQKIRKNPQTCCIWRLRFYQEGTGPSQRTPRCFTRARLLYYV